MRSLPASGLGSHFSSKNSGIRQPFDRVDEGPEGVDWDRRVEGLVVLIPHEAVVVGPQLLLLLEHAVEQLVGSGAIRNRRSGDA